MAAQSKYSIEIYSRTGVLLADISGIATSISVTKARNQPDQISFSLSLDRFENYCRLLNVDPKTILVTGVSEIRVRRKGKYVAGGRLVTMSVALSPSEKSIRCQVMGFLWLFSQRITGTSHSGGIVNAVTESYTAAGSNAQTRSNLAWLLIQQTQGLTNGNLGITRGVVGGTSTLYDKTYNRTNLLDALQALTTLQTDPIDIEVTADKVFNTYTHIGSVRPDIVFEYPAGNIMSFDASYDATEVRNEVVGHSQIATDGSQLDYYGEDIPSQVAYTLAQTVTNTDAVDNTHNGLTDATMAVVGAKKNPLVLPTITVNGNRPPYITDYGIGDTVSIKISNYPLLSNINGFYRLEQFVLNIDEGENEQIDLTLSNLSTADNPAINIADNSIIREILSLRHDVNRINTAH